MTSDIQRSLYALQKSGDLDALQTYCQKYLCTETDALFRGCLLWNLSDVYAMKRDSRALYDNHRRFEEHTNILKPMYRLWLVSDATQRLTLEQGDFEDAWWQWYNEATADYDPDCEAALFNAHRTAFYKSPKMPYDPNRAIWVKDRFHLFLEQTRHSPSTAFYRLIYTALCVKHFGEAEQDLFFCSEPFFADLRHPAEEPLYSPGEWDALNRRRARSAQAQVGINNAVNALIDSGNVKQARELYKTAREYGLNPNDYIEQRLYACCHP